MMINEAEQTNQTEKAHTPKKIQIKIGNLYKNKTERRKPTKQKNNEKEEKRKKTYKRKNMQGIAVTRRTT